MALVGSGTTVQFKSVPLKVKEPWVVVGLVRTPLEL